MYTAYNRSFSLYCFYMYKDFRGFHYRFHCIPCPVRIYVAFDMNFQIQKHRQSEAQTIRTCTLYMYCIFNSNHQYFNVTLFGFGLNAWNFFARHDMSRHAIGCCLVPRLLCTPVNVHVLSIGSNMQMTLAKPFRAWRVWGWAQRCADWCQLWPRPATSGCVQTLLSPRSNNLCNRTLSALNTCGIVCSDLMPCAPLSTPLLTSMHPFCTPHLRTLSLSHIPVDCTCSFSCKCR